MAIITINGKQYNDKKFTKTTKNILASLNFTNNEINKINITFKNSNLSRVGTNEI